MLRAFLLKPRDRTGRQCEIERLETALSEAHERLRGQADDLLTLSTDMQNGATDIARFCTELLRFSNSEMPSAMARIVKHNLGEDVNDGK